MTTVSPRLIPDPDVVQTELENGEVVLLSLTTRKYFSLNPTGARVWALVSEGRGAREISHALSLEFDVTPQQALPTVEALLDELLANGLVCSAGSR